MAGKQDQITIRVIHDLEIERSIYNKWYCKWHAPRNHYGTYGRYTQELKHV